MYLIQIPIASNDLPVKSRLAYPAHRSASRPQSTASPIALQASHPATPRLRLSCADKYPPLQPNQNKFPIRYSCYCSSSAGWRDFDDLSMFPRHTWFLKRSTAAQQVVSVDLLLHIPFVSHFQ